MVPPPVLPNPRRPKVVVHTPFTGWLITSELAAMVPVESAVPMAVAHSPTFREDCVAVTVVV